MGLFDRFKKKAPEPAPTEWPKAPELPVQDILNYLYTMSCWQIIGKQLYRNMALIPLTPEVEVICKQSGEKLYFIGG